MTAKVFSLSESQTDNTFCNNFSAILHRRMLSYTTNLKFAFFDLILPMLIMGFGLVFTSFDAYKEAESFIVMPNKVTDLQ
jgi:hypothetical protein